MLVWEAPGWLCPGGATENQTRAREAAQEPPNIGETFLGHWNREWWHSQSWQSSRSVWVGLLGWTCGTRSWIFVSPPTRGFLWFYEDNTSTWQLLVSFHGAQESLWVTSSSEHSMILWWRRLENSQSTSGKASVVWLPPVLEIPFLAEVLQVFWSILWDFLGLPSSKDCPVPAHSSLVSEVIREIHYLSKFLFLLPCPWKWEQIKPRRGDAWTSLVHLAGHKRCQTVTPKSPETAVQSWSAPDVCKHLELLYLAGDVALDGKYSKQGGLIQVSSTEFEGFAFLWVQFGAGMEQELFPQHCFYWRFLLAKFDFKIVFLAVVDVFCSGSGFLGCWILLPFLCPSESPVPRGHITKLAQVVSNIVLKWCWYLIGILSPGAFQCPSALLLSH